MVAAGAAVGGGEGDLALLVKLSRVVLLAPVLMLLGWWLRREAVVAGASGGAGGPEVGAAPALGVARGPAQERRRAPLPQRSYPRSSPPSSSVSWP